MKRRCCLPALVISIILVGLHCPTRAEEAPKVQLSKVADGFTLPVHIASTPAFPDDIFIVEQRGRVYRIQNGQKIEQPVLDLVDQVESGGEKGLLSIAFHPNFANNPKIYLNYTTRNEGAEQLYTVVSEMKYSSAAAIAVPSSERVLLQVDQPYENHNGGQLAFGPDGMLYIGMGDGGSRMDPKGHGQNTNTLLGAMLRIDVNEGDPYMPPIDNPFVGTKKGKPEIWAYGLRNPWRFSFDRETGQLWVADVGQDKQEEISILERGGNYGWDSYEGTICYRTRFECLDAIYQPPVHTYGRSQGKSVTGGFVYRGKEIPELIGKYVYADYVSGRIWALTHSAGAKAQNEELLASDKRISSFGEDVAGELYVLDHASGAVFRLHATGSTSGPKS